MLQVSGDQPRTCGVRQCEKRQFGAVRAAIRPWRGIGQMDTFLDQIFEPEGWKLVPQELRPGHYFAVLCRDPRADHDLYLPLENPIDHELCGSAVLPHTG